ncbi:MAG: hypothetical protein H7122_20525 [Chitinophagaceae bacterium]|nr:hypothetical protein [Chitinophagaceae bacterium]
MICRLQGLAQQTIIATGEDYLKKGRKLETTAWVLVGSGVTMITAGTILALNTEWGDLDYDDAYHGRQETMKATGSVVLIGAGVIASIGSIPLFVMSAKNKRKAASFSFSNQQYQHLSQGKISKASLPGITFRLSL